MFYKLDEWLNFRKKNEFDLLGFVPTMGALHAGHLSLIQKSILDCNKTVVSIFVNPAQFNDPKDFLKYPKSLETDLKKLKDINVDYVLVPENSVLYADDYKYKVIETSLSKVLCGKNRPGHFDGVLTILMKLFHIVKPQKAYFGEKDYQQFLLVKEMVKAFFLDLDIISSSTIREEDGLAMSSRNQLLSPSEREKAATFHKILSQNRDKHHINEELQKNGFKVDYVEEFFSRRFSAVSIGSVRLIDNLEIS